MNLVQALTYTFDDPQWLPKLLATAALGFMTVLLLPLMLAGLVPFAVLLGYLLAIIDNMRGKTPKAHPLPVWADLSALFYRGGPLLLAMVVYNIPVMILTGCIITLPQAFGASVTTSFITLAILGCLLPVMIGYLLVTGAMLAVGVARYTRDGQSAVFYRAGLLFEEAQQMGAYSLQWALAVTIVNLATIILLFIPVAGWLVILMMLIPVQGHLLGQFTRHFDHYTQKRRGNPA